MPKKADLKTPGFINDVRRFIIPALRMSPLPDFFEKNWLAILESCVLALLLKLWRNSRLRLHHLPGPQPSNWISGNAADLGNVKPWIRFTEWSRKYGEELYSLIVRGAVTGSGQVVLSISGSLHNTTSSSTAIRIT